MSPDPSVNRNADRTAAHLENERAAAAAGVGYPEPTRTLLVTVGGIKYRIFAALVSWRADDDMLRCERCGQDLQMIAPNLLHELPMALCACSSGFMEPLDDRDRGLLSLAHPVSERDAKLAENFHRELGRLAKEGSR